MELSAWLDRVPLAYPELYKDDDKGIPFVYNPLSNKGVVVLDDESFYILNLLDGKRSVLEIFEEVCKVDGDVKIERVVEIISSLLEAKLIYFEEGDSKLGSVEEKEKKNDGRLLRIWIHITNRCNLRCVYCFVGKTAERMNIEEGVENLYRLIREAKEKGYREIVCNFGGGEPLTEWEGVLEMGRRGKEEAVRCGIEIRFGIITNATLLTPEKVEVIQNEQMFVAVSMDGLGKYQDRQRPYMNGRGSYEEAIRGVRLLQERGVSFNLICVVTKMNVRHLPKFTEFSMKEGIPVSYGFYKDTPHAEQKLAASNAELIKYFKLALKKVYKYPPRYTLLRGFLDMIALDYPHVYPCRAGRHYIVLRHDGKLAFCSVKVDTPIADPRPVDKLIEITQKNSLLDPKSRTVNDIGECRKCLWRYSCCGGCPLMTKMYKGTYLSNSPTCQVFRALIPELLKTEAHRLLVHEKL